MPRKKVDPVNQPQREFHTADIRVADVPDADIENRGEIIFPVDKPINKEYLAELAFYEDEMTIRIEPSNEENAPLVVDCWVQGKGAEVKDPRTGKFVQLNCLPIGQPITTKRKYVEVLARSLSDRYSSKQEIEHPEPGQDGYRLRGQAARRVVFSVIQDANPKGAAWLTQVLSER